MKANGPQAGDKLRYPISFPLFSSQLNLVGPSYEVCRLALWLWMIGGLLRKIPIAYMRIRTDLRFPLMVFKPPGQGGGAIMNSMCRILKGVEAFTTPTSYHEEQVVGKVLHINAGKPNETTINNYGYAHDPFVIFDEALPLILDHDREYRKFWGYMNRRLTLTGSSPSRNAQ